MRSPDSYHPHNGREREREVKTDGGREERDEGHVWMKTGGGKGTNETRTKAKSR